MNRKYITKSAAAALAMILTFSALPAEYAADCGFAAVAFAASAQDIWEELPCRICGGGYGALKVTPAGSGRLKLSWEGSKSKTYGVYINYTDSEPIIVHGTSVTISGLTDGNFYGFLQSSYKRRR